MTIALKIGNDDSQVKGFIYLDAVTSYTRNMGGKVTSFPLDSGVNISDHFIGNNRKFQLEGIITGADLTGLSDLVKIDNQKPMNARKQPQAATVEGPSGDLSFIPSGVSQFFQSKDVKVSGVQGGTFSVPEIEELLSNLLTGSFYNAAEKRWRNKMVTTVLYEMDGVNFANARTDLVITDVSIREDAETGDALFISMSLEKVRFVTLDKTEMPKNAKPEVKKKVTATENKGKVDTLKGKLGEADPSKLAPKIEPAGNFRDALTVSRNHLASRR